MNVYIDDKLYEVNENKTVLELCRENNINIPTLCYDERLKPYGGCRLCIVEVEGMKGPVSSCTTEVHDGMKIHTHTEKIIKQRRQILDLLYSNHPRECLQCNKSGRCKLQDYCYEYGVETGSYEGAESKPSYDLSSPFFKYDSRKCIKCGLCVRTCQELQGEAAISFKKRGFNTLIGAPFDSGFGHSDCVSCGNCVSVCPTGALQPKIKKQDPEFRYWETKKTRTTCSYCGVGCQIDLVTKGNEVVDVLPAKAIPNDGLLCVKGKFGYKFINNPDRLKTPLIKKDGKFVEATWDEAYALIKEKFDENMAKNGPQSFAGFSSARTSNEENYLFQKFVRTVFKTNNVDHCARLCHASTVAGLANTLGSGAMTNSIAEVADADAFFVIGSNTTETHPVIGTKIRKRVREGGAKLVVADPREIQLAKMADVYLQIKPGTNVAIMNGMMHVILEENLQDDKFIEERTEDFEELREVLKKYTPEYVAEICGVKAEDIVKAARIYATADKASIFYSMGVTQHSTGTNGVMSTSNLAMMTGHMGRESCGVNPLRGQNNVQGACDMGALPTDYTGYQKVFLPAVRDKMSKAWGTQVPEEKGKTIVEILNGAHDGTINFLYIMGENPMISDPDINHTEKALKNLDFLVVQDIFLTETAEFADVVLPAASFAEKDGTFTNTERRVLRVRKAIDCVGQAKPDWQIIMELSTLLGHEEHYDSPADIMDEIASVTPSYGGMSYDRLEQDGGLQWPCTNKDHPGTKFLHKDVMARGKGLFKAIDYVPSKELPDEEYPIVLTTGRILYHYHTRTMSGKVPGLNQIVANSYIEINPQTAADYGIKNGELVEVSSRRGSVQSRARVTDKIEEGVIFMPFHFADGPANKLTNPVLDPTAKIPELKVAAVSINKIEGACNV